MKRVLVILSLIAALFIAGSCTYETNLSVTASAALYYDNGDIVNVAPVTFEGIHSRYLTEYDLEDIFLDLTQHVIRDFRTARMYLEIYDDISGKHLRDEIYNVTVDGSGRLVIEEGY
jgi:hypothetical protein